ncbi:MAG: hypothetical protein QW607_12470, partial [Desulfurococcaceae archaeon]
MKLIRILESKYSCNDLNVQCNEFIDDYMLLYVFKSQFNEFYLYYVSLLNPFLSRLIEKSYGEINEKKLVTDLDTILKFQNDLDRYNYKVIDVFTDETYYYVIVVEDVLFKNNVFLLIYS